MPIPLLKSQLYGNANRSFGATGGIIIDKNKLSKSKDIQKIKSITKGPFIDDAKTWITASQKINQLSGSENVSSGGSAANTAYIVAILLDGLKKHSTTPSVWFQGIHAGDASAEHFKNDLKKANIADHTEMSQRNNAHTGTCLVMIEQDNKGERHMFTAPGVSNDFMHLNNQNSPKLFENIGIYEVENYGLTDDNINIFKNNFKSTHENGGKTLLTLANKHVTAHNRDKIMSMIGSKDDQTNIDILVGNEEEFTTLLTDQLDKPLSSDELLKHAKDFAKKHQTELIITLGNDGSAIISPQGELTLKNAYKTDHIVDTTGAGDSYLGGFIAARLAGLDTKSAADIATETAGVVIQHKGSARPPKEKFIHIIEKISRSIQNNEKSIHST